MSMIRKFILMMVLSIVLAFVPAGHAHAAAAAGAAAARCSLTVAFPTMFAGCLADFYGAVSDALGSVSETVMKSFWLQVQMHYEKKLGTAKLQVDQATRANTLMADYLNDTGPSVSRASCQSITVGAITTGGGWRAEGAARPKARISFKNPNARFPEVVMPPDDLRGRSAEAVTGESRAIVNEQLLRKRRIESEGSSVGAIVDNKALGVYRPCEGDDKASCESEKKKAKTENLLYADVKIDTILGQDTYLGTDAEGNNPTMNAAIAACSNLMTPLSPDRVAGKMDTDKMIADAYARSGDARISLALKACIDAVMRRKGIPYSKDNKTYDWLIQAACVFRRTQDELDKTSLKGIVGAYVENKANPAASCGTGADVSKDIELSQLELLRIASTDLLSTSTYASNAQSANATELQRMLLVAENVNAAVNFEILRMQEHLQLLKAANLAVDINVK